VATRLTRAETKKDTTGGYTFNPCGNKKYKKDRWLHVKPVR